MESYATKQNRKKLLKAYSAKEPLAALLYLPQESELALRTSGSRLLLGAHAARRRGADPRRGHCRAAHPGLRGKNRRKTARQGEIVLAIDPLLWYDNNA